MAIKGAVSAYVMLMEYKHDKIMYRTRCMLSDPYLGGNSPGVNSVEGFPPPPPSAFSNAPLAPSIIQLTEVLLEKQVYIVLFCFYYSKCN